MELTDGRGAQHNFGDTMAVAIAQVQRLRENHDWLLSALKCMVTLMDEVVDDLPNPRTVREAIAAARRVISRAEGG